MIFLKIVHCSPFTPYKFCCKNTAINAVSIINKMNIKYQNLGCFFTQLLGTKDSASVNVSIQIKFKKINFKAFSIS